MVKLNEGMSVYRITDAVKDYLKRNKITQTKLAKMMGESLPSLQKKLGRDDIGVAYMTRISLLLNYDFLCEASYKNEVLEFGFEDQKKDAGQIDKKFHAMAIRLLDKQSELIDVQDRYSKLERDYQILLSQAPVRPIRLN